MYYIFHPKGPNKKILIFLYIKSKIGSGVGALITPWEVRFIKNLITQSCRGQKVALLMYQQILMNIQ